MEDTQKKLRFVCVSDTHGLTDRLQLPEGDVLIHAGDFSNIGEPDIIEEFNTWLGEQPHPIKVVIAGNHDVTFDVKNYPELCKTAKLQGRIPLIDPLKAKSLLTNCIYLEDSSIIVHGYKIYGSPWTPFFDGKGFNVHKGKQLKEIWEKIPSDTEILITHGPPYGILDKTITGVYAGCEDLMKVIQERVKPLYHIFGHVHEGYGTEKKDGTVFINASICTQKYSPSNKPIVFELSVKEKEAETAQ